MCKDQKGTIHTHHARAGRHRQPSACCTHDAAHEKSMEKSRSPHTQRLVATTNIAGIADSRSWRRKYALSSCRVHVPRATLTAVAHTHAPAPSPQSTACGRARAYVRRHTFAVRTIATHRRWKRCRRASCTASSACHGGASLARQPGACACQVPRLAARALASHSPTRGERAAAAAAAAQHGTAGRGTRPHGKKSLTTSAAPASAAPGTGGSL